MAGWSMWMRWQLPSYVMTELLRFVSMEVYGGLDKEMIWQGDDLVGQRIDVERDGLRHAIVASSSLLYDKHHDDGHQLLM